MAPRPPVASASDWVTMESSTCPSCRPRRYTPLLPRAGYRSSTCSLKSEYTRPVTRFAPPWAFVSTPFTALHWFVPPTACQPPRSLPSNSWRTAPQSGVARRSAGARTAVKGNGVPLGSVIVPDSPSPWATPANCRSALPASHCGGIAKRSVSLAYVSREIGRTLPTTPWKRPTSTPLPETWTSSHDGSGRPSRAVRVRSHVPTTGGGAGSCAESDDITTTVAVRIDAWRIIRELQEAVRAGIYGPSSWGDSPYCVNSNGGEMR